MQVGKTNLILEKGNIEALSMLNYPFNQKLDAASGFSFYPTEKSILVHATDRKLSSEKYLICSISILNSNHKVTRHFLGVATF